MRFKRSESERVVFPSLEILEESVEVFFDGIPKIKIDKAGQIYIFERIPQTNNADKFAFQWKGSI